MCVHRHNDDNNNMFSNKKKKKNDINNKHDRFKARFSRGIRYSQLVKRLYSRII